MTVYNGLRLFVSGDHVEPGRYRDIETGATVVVYEHDTLPELIRIVHDRRLFVRVEEAVEAADADRPLDLAEVA